MLHTYGQSALHDTRISDRPISVAETRITPLLKWPGGKSGELGAILPRLPVGIDKYFEPFVGGGAIFFSVSSSVPAFINDKSSDLINFYRCVATSDQDFFAALEDTQRAWAIIERFVEKQQAKLIDLYTRQARSRAVGSQVISEAEKIANNCYKGLTHLALNLLDYDPNQLNHELRRNLLNKLRRMSSIQKLHGRLPEDDIADNIEGAFKSAFYMHLRHLYNHSIEFQLKSGYHTAVFFFLREHAYASMFRFNRNGGFNVPYGGISYNRKDFGRKVERLRDLSVRSRLANAVIENRDFEQFLGEHAPGPNDFLFLDPPYDSDFSDYDQNRFGATDQIRLAEYLTTQCRAGFLLVIKATDLITSLYENKGLRIESFDKTYMWTIKERNNRDTTHLVISNY